MGYLTNWNAWYPYLWAWVLLPMPTGIEQNWELNTAVLRPNAAYIKIPATWIKNENMNCGYRSIKST